MGKNKRIKCSKAYFDKVDKIFTPLKQIKIKSNSTQKWTTLPNKEDDVYAPILNAFKEELLRIYNTSPKHVATRLIEYLVGTKDFYKVIKSDNFVEIQAYNIHGTLNLPFKNIEPKFKTPKVNLPNKIIDVAFKKNSKTTLIVQLDNDWELSFRIHNASSRIEPSLKFDINLLKAPKSLFKNTLSVS